MKPMIEQLEKIKVKKHVVTSIEYDCQSEKKENEVFDTVQDIVTSDLDGFAKITYDVTPDHKVKVEVTRNIR